MADWYVSSVAYAAIPAWAATTAYTVGQFMRPLTPTDANQLYVFRCTTAGTTASGQPFWAGTTTNNGTITSGTATFTLVSGQSAYGWSAASGNLYCMGNAYSNRPVAGDRIFVSSDHSESSTGLTFAFGGSVGFGLIQIISVNRAGSVPPVAADAQSGAAISASGGLTLEACLNMFWQGVLFTISGATAASIQFNSSFTKTAYFKSCAFVLSSSSSAAIRNTAAARVIWDNTTIQFGNVIQSINANAGPFELIWLNTPSAIVGATIPTALFFGAAQTMMVTCRGVDLSAVVGTLLKTTTNSEITKVLLDSCKIAAAVTRYAMTSTTGDPAYDEIELVNCFDGTNIINERHTAAGDVTTDATTTLSRGARDNVGGYSHKLVSSPRADVCTMPLDGFWLDVENTGVGGSKTAMVEIVSSASLNNNDIKLQLEYMGTSSSALASFGESLASVLTAAAALGSSSATWNNPPTTPQKQQLQVPFTPQTAGRVKGLVRLGKPSATVWVNPQVIFVTPTLQSLAPALFSDSDVFYAAWTPASLATLKGWYKGDLLTGADASSLTSWPDSSGLGNNATVDINNPILQTAEQNSLNVVQFGFQAYFLLPNIFSGATACAAVFVARTINTAKGSPLKFGTDTQESHYPYSDNNIYDDFASTARKSVGNPGVLTSWHIGSFHSTNSSWKYYRNGVSFFSTSSNTFAARTTNLAIGSSYSSAGFFYDGMIGEVVVVNEFLSDADRQKIEGYLAWKWGLVGSLDVTHPYKSAAP